MAQRKRKRRNLAGTEREHATNARLAMGRFERWESEFQDAFNGGDCTMAFHAEGAMSAALTKAAVSIDEVRTGWAGLRKEYNNLRRRRDRYSAAFVRSCVRKRKA
jgi:hypothetical protein